MFGGKDLRLTSRLPPHYNGSEVMTMADLFDYLRWRGDILFSQLPPTPVDALIFSALSYIRFQGIIPETPGQRVALADAAGRLLAQPGAEKAGRVKTDLELLRAAADSPRFSQVGLSFYQDVFIPEKDTQFAAVTFLLSDGSAFLAFRGTDNTLVGWKEDFNMSFEERVPAQRLARDYVMRFTAAAPKVPLRLGGHSKGGNLAVYAAAKCTPAVQRRILAVYNQDGPGFTEHMLTDAGYRRIVPKIHTYVPQSSVIGMLLEHEEPYNIIKSTQLGLLQHDLYSWAVMAGGFITVQSLTADSRFIDRTLKNWLAGMTIAERNEFVDTVFDLLMVGDTRSPRDLIRPQNLRAYLKTLQTDEDTRRIIAEELVNLAESARKAFEDGDEPK